MNLYTIHAMDFKPEAAGNAAFQLSQIQNQRIDPALERAIGRAEGSADVQATGILGARYDVSGSTSQIKTFLDSCLLTPYVWDGDGTNDHEGLIVGFRKIKPDGGGARVPIDDAEHITCTYEYGTLVPQTLESGTGLSAPASLSFQAVPRSEDGETCPMAISKTATLDAADTADELFGPGPLKINDVLYDTDVSWSLEFGYAVVQHGGSGLPYVQYVGAGNRGGLMIRVQMANPEAMFDMDPEGTVLDSGKTTAVYLRRGKMGELYYGEAETEHISITVSEGMAYPEPISGDHNAQAAGSIVIAPRKGTPDIVVCSTSATIPTS